MRSNASFTYIICLLAISASAAPSRSERFDAAPASQAAPENNLDQSGSSSGTELKPGTTGGNSVCGEVPKFEPKGISFGRNYRPVQLTIPLDMRNFCVPKPIGLAVSDMQNITLSVVPPEHAQCKATESIQAVAKPDILATIVKAVAAGAGAGAIKALDATRPSSERPLTFQLPPVKNSQATIVVSCTADKGFETTVVAPKKTLVVTYQNIPNVSASAGTIVSLLGKKTYGVVTTPVSVSSGAVTSQYTIGVTSSSTTQLVPIGFLNLYGLGTRDKHIDFQAGLGINPNGSKTRVEYFLGPAFAWKGLFISPGLHIAQAQYLSNGYVQGETVSSQGFTVPTTYKTTLKFGFGISYSPKLPSSGASK